MSSGCWPRHGNCNEPRAASTPFPCPVPKERDHRRITPPTELVASPGSQRRKITWQIARFVLSLFLAAYALKIVYGQRDELAGATGYLEHIRWQWLAAAAVVEAISMVAFAALQRRLLLAGRLLLPLTTSTAIALAGNSIQNSLPAGPVFSGIFAFRQFRGRGADEVLAWWTLVATAAMAQIALVILAVIGLAGASGTGSALDLVSVILGLVVLAALIVASWNSRAWIMRHLVGPVRLVQRVVKRPAGNPRDLIEDLLGRMNAISPTSTDWVMAVVFALANWTFDVGCLIAAFTALGAPVPWRALLLAYTAAQLAANLPITPGGLGVVEGSLVIGLVAFGGGQASTVAAVLLYRLLSFWALLPIGWLAWAYSNWDLRRRQARAGPEKDPEKNPEKQQGREEHPTGRSAGPVPAWRGEGAS